MHYHFKINKEDDGFWGQCVELQGCQSQGDTFEELLDNLAEALNLYLDEPQGSNVVFPLPNEEVDENREDIIKIAVDPGIAFANYLRIIRLGHKMTQKEVAIKLGYKSIWAYQKLESTKKANPELKTIAKIKSLFPEFDLNRLFA